MKAITAIIQSHMLHNVMAALHVLPHFPGVTVCDCQGQGRGTGAGGHFEATKDTIFLKKMTRLELFCADDMCDALVKVLQTAAHTGNPGDGVIVVADLARVVRVRSGQEQEAAV